MLCNILIYKAITSEMLSLSVLINPIIRRDLLDFELISREHLYKDGGHRQSP